MDLVAWIRSFTFARRAALFAGVTLLLGVANAGTVTYTVDPASGRVLKATFPDTSYITYTYDGNGNRTSAILTSAADTTPPSAPGTPTFSAITATSATASWSVANDNVAIASYEYSRNGGSTWTNVGNVLSASITGLTGSTSYTVLVRARDAANNVGPTSSNSFTTADTTAPSVPGTPTFSSITATSATASWSAATDNVGVASYEYSRNGGSTWTNVGNTLSTSITGLTGSTSYTVLVRAKDAANNTGAASSGSFTTSDTTPPSAPGNPTFSSITTTSATATWTAATDNIAVTSYEYSRNGGSTWTDVGNVLSTSITGLSPSTAYTVLVRAKDAALNTGPNGSGTFTTSAAVDGTAPSAPGTPTFSSITGTSATASWAAATDNVGVTSYEWTTNGGSSWNNVGNVLSASLTGLTNGTSYSFQVRARDAANNVGSASSNSFSTLDTAAPTTPGAPTFSSITGTSATASWTAATDNLGVARYEWSINGGSSWTNVGNTLSASITGLTNGTSYTVYVRALDAVGNAGSASGNSFSTLDTAAPSTPGAPTFSSITGTTATASWTASSDNVGVTSYEWTINGGSSWTNVGNTLSVSITGLTNGTSYTVYVHALDAAGNPSSANGNSFTTLDTAAPTAPGTPTFSSITGSSATVSWGAATDNVGVFRYEWSTNGGASWVNLGNTLSASLTGLTNGTGYTVYVRAVDATGNAGSASGNSFTTLDTAAPSAPGTPTFSGITGSSATASWTAASDNVGVTSYEWSINGGSSWNNVGNTLSASITGLSTGATYTIYVRALDGAGNAGGASNNSFTTVDNVAPGAPGAPSFSSIGSTTALGSWSAASDNIGVTSYEYSVNSGSSWTNVGNTTTATVSGLAPAATTTVLIRARDAAGNAGTSSSGSVTTIAQITIANRTVATTTPGFSGGSAIYQLRNDGDILVTQPTSSTAIDGGDWLVPKVGMGNFQVMGTLASGSGACSSGTMGTWLNLSTSPGITWAVGRGGPSGTTSCTVDIQVRHSSNPSVILGTARIWLSITN